MKRVIPACIIASALLLPAACAGPDTAPDKGQIALIEASRRELATAVAERDQLLALVTEISSSMDRIKHLENMLTLTRTAPDENKTQRAIIMDDITLVRATLRERREKLSELESQLRQSTLYTEELQATINALRHLINTQAAELESLLSRLSAASERIDSLSSTVDSLSTSVMLTASELDSANRTSAMLADELNTCYYVVASKSDLKRHSIIETGFLRSTRLLPGDFDREFFTVTDKRRLSALPLASGKVKILTNHPDGSYTLSDGADGHKTLLITDSLRFWSLSNYLVVQTD